MMVDKGVISKFVRACGSIMWRPYATSDEAHLQMTRRDRQIDNKLCEDAAITCHAFELSTINTTPSILFPLSLSAPNLQMMSDIKAFGISLWAKVASHGQYQPGSTRS
jgi:hypothetical protein